MSRVPMNSIKTRFNASGILPETCLVSIPCTCIGFKMNINTLTFDETLHKSPKFNHSF